MKFPTVSVVIPYYNDSLVFERTLDSIYNQTLQPSEIVIVNDFSEDKKELMEIINIYKEKLKCNIQIFHNKKNMNGAYSRNLGIKNCKSVVVALLDADDYWEKEHLYKSVEALVLNKMEFVFSNILIENPMSDKNIVEIKVTDPKILKNCNDILFYNPPQTNSFVFIRDVLLENSISFDEKLRRHQDWQFLIDVINSNVKYKYIDIATSYYCMSHRPYISRVDYDSIFQFWSTRKKLFTLKKLEKYLIYMWMECFLYKGAKGADEVIEKYPILCFIESQKAYKISKINILSVKQRFRLMYYFTNFNKIFPAILIKVKKLMPRGFLI